MWIVMAGSHVVVGIAAWTLVAPHLGLPLLDPAALGLTTVGVLVPDIDHPPSWVGRRVPVVSRPQGSDDREQQDLWGARGRRVASGRFRLSSRLPKMRPAVPLFRGTPEILMLSQAAVQ
jgi:hypothetical protein